jgi:hypothetical protein
MQSFVFVADAGIEVRAPQAGDPWSIPTDTQVQVPLTAVAASPALPVPNPYAVHVQMNGALSVDEPSLHLQ